MKPLQARWYGIFWLAAVAMALAVVTSGIATAQVAGNRYEGILTIMWGTPQPGFSGGETRFTLNLPDGTEHALQVGPDQQSFAAQYFGKRVVVEGQPLAAPNAFGESGIVVNRITSAEPAGPAQIVQPQVAVTRRVLYILLRYKGDTQQPHPASFFKSLTNPLTPPAGSNVGATLNGFFSKTSWGKLQWKADVFGVGGLAGTVWLTLPRTKAQYANCGFNAACADLALLRADALALVRTKVNLALFDNVNFVLNNDLDCCAWGGSFFDVTTNKVYGATYEPPWGQEAGTYAHEFGHSIGLPHSGWVYKDYDSPWDMMSARASASSVACGSYKSANNAMAVRSIFCTEPGNGYIAAHKDVLGWIPAANRVVISQKGTRTVILVPNSLPLGTGIKMIKICLVGELCDGPTAHYLTVEARIKTAQFEKALPGEGVIIHDFRKNRAAIGGGNACFFNSQSGWAVPIDATPGDWRPAPFCDPGPRVAPNYGLLNAQFVPGKKYVLLAKGITVTVVSRTGSNYRVTVARTK